MKKILIVNADDCNLTPGVTRAILDCHDCGILTSTTFMVNLPVEPKTVRALKKRKKLGVGIHLNVTFGYPVSRTHGVESLLDDAGQFKKYAFQKSALPKAQELFREYQNQIHHFHRLFGYLPTHLDTHHQMHDHPFFLEALAAAAKRFNLPVRRSVLTPSLRGTVFVTKSARESADPSFGGQSGFTKTDCHAPSGIAMTSLRTTDYFFGNLTVQGYWRAEPLETLLANMPEGISEIMCHPGENDAALRSVSSFQEGRESEWKLFGNPKFKKRLENGGVTLANFSVV